ncbi:oligosaccharide flippase family protein [Actinomycetospora sp. NBRC 106378]|uniref:oligosaccharide flippase family protein n=1 Tax=Actinomycetospora sp. NBRC 106378 TaxID=3032208 RepID=UPI002555E69A|nr:oligosaccharide flippase family protein [Actinomycetospora sp. NBRC 106378]
MNASMRNKIKSRLGRNTLASFAGQLAKTGLQGAYFVIVARALDVDGFGAFSAVVALAAILSPFASLGTMSLVIRNVVRDPSSASEQISTALCVTIAASSLCVCAIAVVGPMLLPASVGLTPIVLVALGDILGIRVAELCYGLFASSLRMTASAVFQLLMFGARLLGAVALFVFGFFTLEAWSVVYVSVTGMIVAVIVLYTRRQYSFSRPDFNRYRSEYKDGLLFAVGLASQSIYNDVDKAMLARFSTLDAVGVYTAAYRVIDMAFTPVRALLSASFPRFFQHGATGAEGAMRFAGKVLRPSLLYCALSCVGLLLFADVVPLVLGEGYINSVDVLRALSVLLLLKAFHYFAADALSGAGYQVQRSVTQISMAVINVAINIPLITSYGYWGAVYSSLITDGMLAAILWLLLLNSRRRETNALQHSARVLS